MFKKYGASFEGGFKPGKEYKNEICRRYKVDDEDRLTHTEAKEWLYCIAHYLDKDRYSTGLVIPDTVEVNELAWKSNKFQTLDGNCYNILKNVNEQLFKNFIYEVIS